MAEVNPKFHWIIKQGTDAKQTWVLNDADTGQRADLTAGVVTMRGSIKDAYGGVAIAKFKNSAGWDGLITGDTVGNLSVEFPASFTTTLAANKRAVFDIEIVNIASGKTYRPIEGTAAITPEVTTDA